MTQPAPPIVLLVEDDPRTVATIAGAIAAGLPAPPQLVARPTISLAWDWLAGHPPPALIVIDQYLAAGERGEVLAERLRGDPRLAGVPRIGYSQAPMPAATFTVCLRKGPGHAELLAQIALLLGGAG